MKIKYLIVLLLVFGLAGSASAVTETFDTDLGKWTMALDNTDTSNNFGFSNTNNAGGAGPGEAGGTFSRHTWSYIGDGLGTTLTSSEVIEMSGTAKLINENMDGTMWIGFFDSGYTFSSGDSEVGGLELGLKIREPDNGSFRVQLKAGGSLTENFYVDDNTVWTYDLTYDGSGLFSGTLNGESVELSASPGDMDAFGMGTGHDGTEMDPTCQMYLDDVSYTPEPATVALLGLGSLFLARRKRRAC